MNGTDLVAPQHLAPKAMNCIRQSCPHQVLFDQVSLRLRPGLQQCAQVLGSQPEDVQIVEADLRRSAASAQRRESLKEVLAEVTFGHVRITLSFMMARLSRSCTARYPLLAVCASWNCLIADRAGVCDPTSARGHLLPGLKGRVSELELHTIRTPLTTGLLNKAQLGEFTLGLPVRLSCDDNVLKAPYRHVQGRIALVFCPFLQVYVFTPQLARVGWTGPARLADER